MRWRWAPVMAVVTGLAVPAVSYAAGEKKEFKYAYVNMEKLIDEYVLFKEARETAESKIEEARVDDKAKLTEYQTTIDELESKLAGPLTDEAKAEAMETYKTVVQEALDFRNGALAKYKRMERDAFEPVYKKVYEKIESYAVKNDYEIVFDYSAILLYADEENDITEEVVMELNEEAGIK